MTGSISESEDARWNKEEEEGEMREGGKLLLSVT